MRRVLTALLVCMLAFATAAAPAAEGDAKQAFIDGTKLYENGQVDEALEKFKIALEATGSPNARLYVARCLQALNRNAEAYAEMKRTMKEASARAATSRKYAKTRDAAASQMALIEPLIAKVVIAVVGGDEETKVTIDGEEVPAEKLGVPLPFDPKKLVLRAERPGKIPAEKEVELEAGSTQTVTLQLKDPDTGGAGGGGGGSGGGGGGGDTGAQSGGLNGMQIAGIVVGGIGVAGMVMFGVTGSMAADRESTLEDECFGINCRDPKYQDTIDEGELYKLLANVGLGVGIAGVAGGVALLTIGSLGDDEAEAAKNATIQVSPTGGYVGYRWHF